MINKMGVFITIPFVLVFFLAACSSDSSISTPEEIPGAVLSGTISTDSSSTLTTKTQTSGGTVYALDLTSGEVITAPLADDGTFSVELTAEQTDDDLILIVTDTSGIVTAVLEFNYGDNATSTVPLPDAGISGEYNLGDFTVDSSTGTASAGSGNDLGDTVLSGETIVPGQMTPLAAGYADTDGNNIPDILDALIGQTFDSSSYSTPLATFRVVDCFCAAGMGYYNSNCDPDDGILCGLTRSLDTTTLTSSSVTADLSDETDVPVTFTNDSLFGSGNTLSITPTSCPAGDTTFKMTTALHDTDGNALAAEYQETFTFTGGDASCNDTIPLPTPPPFLSGFGTTDADYDGIPDSDDNYPARPNMNQMPPRPPNFGASCLAALGGNLAICCSSGALNSSLTADQQTCCSPICPGSIPSAVANAFGGTPLPPPRVVGLDGVTCPPGQTIVGNLCITDTLSGNAPTIGAIPTCKSDSDCGPGGQCNAYTKACNFNNDGIRSPSGAGAPRCGSDRDCGSGATCSAGECRSVSSCSSNAGCRNPFPICSGSVCTPCTSSGQCSSGQTCDPLGACILSTAIQSLPASGICPSGTSLIGGNCLASNVIPNAPIPPTTDTAIPSGAGLFCGDRVCNAAETAAICPTDCSGSSTTTTAAPTSPTTTTTTPTTTTLSALNGTCTTDAGCQSGLFCGGNSTAGRTCKTIGQGQNGIDNCSSNTFCASSNCSGGTCQAAPTVLAALNGTCTTDASCQTGLFCGGNSSVGRTCKTIGQGQNGIDNCSSNTFCASSNCSGGTCQAAPAVCGNSTCESGETAVSCPGDCITTLVSNISNPSGDMSCDATECVYIEGSFSQTDAKVCKVSVAGGTATCIATGLNRPASPIFVGSNICWGNSAAMQADIGIFCKARSGAGNITTVISNVTGTGGGIVSDGTNIYWGDGCEGSCGFVRGVPVGGGSASNLNTTGLILPRGPILNGTTIFFGHDLVANDMASDVLRISRVATSGGGATFLAQANAFVRGLASDGTNLYWTEGTPNDNNYAVKYLPVGGGAITTLASGLENAGAPKVSGGLVYFGGRINPAQAGGVLKIPVTGGSPTVHVSVSGSTSGFDIVGDNLFYIESTGGTPPNNTGALKKVAK